MMVDAFLALLKRVRRSGRGWVALCPAHGDRHHSLSIASENGRILLNCFVGCDVRDICSALNIRLRDLFGPGSNGRFDTARSDARRLEYAERIWRQATEPAVGTVVERYLRNRGITLPVPPAIRFCTLTLEGWPCGMNWPALVAGIQNVAGGFTGVLVTGLFADGSARLPDERRIYGPFRGGAVRLAPARPLLVVAEGVETALSVLQSTKIPTWAALSATNLPHVRVPDCVREVVICADVDPDSTGETAAQRLAVRLTREGKSVRIARPPTPFKDFNDALLRG